MATTKQAKKPAAKKVTAKKANVKSSVQNVKSSAQKVENAVKVNVKSSAQKVENSVDETIEDVTQEANSLFATLKANVAKSRDTAQQAWLLGLGAFGKSADEIKARYEQMVEERQKLVNDLVARGEKVQDEATSALKERRADIEEQIEAARTRVNGFTTELTSGLNIAGRLQNISDKLESFSKDLKKSA